MPKRHKVPFRTHILIQHPICYTQSDFLTNQYILYCNFYKESDHILILRSPTFQKLLFLQYYLLSLAFLVLHYKELKQVLHRIFYKYFFPYFPS